MTELKELNFKHKLEKNKENIKDHNICLWGRKGLKMPKTYPTGALNLKAKIKDIHIPSRIRTLGLRLHINTELQSLFHI